MILFGVTGGIGSGKSTVCHQFRELNVPIIAADPLAKKLTNTLPEIRTALISEFGDSIYLEFDELNKAEMSRLVFSDAECRHKINAIIHPHVLDWIKKEAARLEIEENQELIGVEAALIYESSMHKILNAVIVVSAPQAKRVEWLENRDELTHEEIMKRMASQMPVIEKEALADFVIVNSGDLAHLAAQVRLAYDWLQSFKTTRS